MLISIWYTYSELRTKIMSQDWLVTIAAIQLDLLFNIRRET